MGAIDTRMSVVAASVQAVAAGNDIVLISSYEPIFSPAVMRQAMTAVEQAVVTHRLSRAVDRHRRTACSDTQGAAWVARGERRQPLAQASLK